MSALGGIRPIALSVINDAGAKNQDGGAKAPPYITQRIRCQAPAKGSVLEF